jgi:putative membrane protein
MSVLAQVLVAVAAALHVLFFVMESLLFTRPQVHRRFGLSREHAAIVRPMAFNQGFYNLFLAVGAILGIVLVNTGDATAGVTLAAFACAVMGGAALVLITTDRRFLPAAAVQGVPPLAALALVAA